MKMKSREELLAEERKYKRRRMSYRGKKLKWTPKEVLRDIIEEYMEAIKHIGGVGGLAKGAAEAPMSTSKNSPAHNSTDFEMAHHSSNDQKHGYRKSQDYKHESRDQKPVDASPGRKERQKKEPFNHRHLNDEKTYRDRNSRDYNSRSPSVDRRYRWPREHWSQRRNQCVMEMDEDERSKREYSFLKEMSYNDEKPLNSISSTSRSSSRKEKRKLESPERHRWQKHEDGEGGSSRRDEFSDRYDPSEGYDEWLISPQGQNLKTIADSMRV